MRNGVISRYQNSLGGRLFVFLPAKRLSRWKNMPLNMTTDKQLRGIKLANVLEKRRLDQALNVKEFAVLAGLSYSVAREWFNMKGFPRVQGVVFWQDFIQWRHQQNGGRTLAQNPPQSPTTDFSSNFKRPASAGLPFRAAQILLETVK
jgi:hypothetical protein